ncbi:hypothetical protein DYBT9275_04666 [Dyadobacter sp. CECT 9275]|uniref:Antitoxin component YwqK of the YwqJK toxin-antitoxin module n=1 Tax=Dyadobacter helix TaxID=2822344 RepID=A0A916JFK3_9BACT|nr:hypothetical protein [Dyadobacter sp. CECT 9275]CAG5010214.1 hypothetical protein DYBT9275_04666 [Dyadobacter sp. CECT 9275]
MQRILRIGCLILVSFAGKSVAQTDKSKTSDPSWLPKETVKTDTSKGKHSNDLKSFISGLDPVVNASVPGAGNKSSSLSTLLGETIPDLGLRVKEYKGQKADRKRKKEKARLAKVQYEGIPMQAMSIKYGSGEKATIEIFHVLKEYKPINPYVLATNIRWYDKKSRRLSSSLIKDKEQALPLHGSYKKFSGENLIEEGYYYMGVRHARWLKYDAKYNLIDKSYWGKGFPAESRITYYDSTHTQIKEVLPVSYGKVEGEFLQFYKEGQLMASGKYQNGEKVGRWIEYYQFRRQRKKEIQYRKTFWDEGFEPFILREWDEKGKLFYDSSKDPRASVEEETEN